MQRNRNSSLMSALVLTSAIGVCGLFGSAATAGPSGGPYEITWYTIDAGGTSLSSGGSFDLSGTVGQPDASNALVGGSFSLTGGFWAGVDSAAPCPGDLTGDGILNFFDVSAFLSAFSSMNPIADFTNDGIFNFFDVSAFLSAFSAGCP